MIPCRPDSGLLGLRDRPGCVDQPDVTELLRKVAEQLAALGVHLLGEQADVVGEGDPLLELPAGPRVGEATNSCPGSRPPWPPGCSWAALRSAEVILAWDMERPYAGLAPAAGWRFTVPASAATADGLLAAGLAVRAYPVDDRRHQIDHVKLLLGYHGFPLPG